MASNATDDGILLLFHCKQDTGYAIESLEHVFHHAALQAGFPDDKICYGYSDLTQPETPRLVQARYDSSHNEAVRESIQVNNVRSVLAFDLQYPSAIIRELRTAGAKRIVSYWGASMSGLNSGLKLAVKRLEWPLRRYKPDLFVFESEGMRQTATHGRGIPATKTEVVSLGVDIERFAPGNDVSYAHSQFDIPVNRGIVFYSGHMERRKGVHVIIEAAKRLIDQHGRHNIHFLICGNQPGEEDRFIDSLTDHPAAEYVTFAGYRSDIPELMRSAMMGTIASTGWDSFTMSSIEMMASGLPIVVSDLPGLKETVVHNESGYIFEAGNADQLAVHIDTLAGDSALVERLSQNARARAVSEFSQEVQIASIAKLLR